MFSFGNTHSTSSKFPTNDVDNVLSVFVFPPMLLALACSDLLSPTCHQTTITICAFASAVFPFAVACTLYMPDETNIWVIGVPLPFVPSPKSRSIPLLFSVLTASKFTVNGALHLILSIVIYIHI